MKKFTLLSIVVCLVISGYAQMNTRTVPASFRNIRLDAPVRIKNVNTPVKPQNTITSSKATLEDVIGSTQYDLQSNASCQNRLYLYSDGKMGGTWTRGVNSPSFAERGTGYNFFDGTAWGTPPNARIENERCGWDSYEPLGPTGEIVVAHNDASGLHISTRAVRNSGPWTGVVLSGPASAPDISWPRMITSGPDHNYIHIIASTYSTYLGLDYALLYYRSLDGGQNWDQKDVILPGMSSTDNYGFDGDDYAWGTPHGDTIYFVTGGNWTDVFIMASFDNGDNWTKIPVHNNGYKMNVPNNYAPPFYCCDGAICVEMDKEGVFHVIFGRMRATDDGSGRKYYPGTDGLIYWNSTMPVLNDSLDADILFANGQLLGWVYSDGNPNDTIVGIAAYGVGLSSFPQITIDNNDYIYAVWSGVTVANPDPNGKNYRHLWHRYSTTHGMTWSDSLDFNAGLTYIYREFCFPSMVKLKQDDYLRFLYQSADVAGSAVKDATVPYHDNTIEYRQELRLITGNNDNPTAVNAEKVSQNMPNPVHGLSVINVRMDHSAPLSLEVYNVAGVKVMTLDKGTVNTGMYTFTVDGSKLQAGIYFYTVKMGDETISKKMIVQ
jgi:hypothetical protein